MTGPVPPVRVEHALRLLPDLEVMTPLRSVLLSLSRPEEGAVWSSSGPYLTVGKRGVQPVELRDRLAEIQQRVADHVSQLYLAYVEAIERQQHGDAAGVVAALLRAGGIEESAGRLKAGHAWYDVGLRIAVEIPSRLPEIDCLDRLGGLASRLARYQDAGRHYQRALVLAEAEFNQVRAIMACEGLGKIAHAQGQWNGAQAWYGRGLRLAESSGDGAALGRLYHRLAKLDRRRSDHANATDHIRRAREQFERIGDSIGMARVLETQGGIEGDLGRHAAAQAALLEALAWAHKAPPDRASALELRVRLRLARLYLDTGRTLEAEEDLRKAEQMAIAGGHTQRLVRIYVLLGRLRGAQRDQTGFVFFEQGIELCRTTECAPGELGHVFHEYAVFLDRVGQREEARSYLERACEIFDSLGEGGDLELARSDLQRLTA